MKFSGRKLQELRKLKGMTITELAEKSGISPSNISGIENNKNIPRPQTVKKLARALGIDEAYFYIDETTLAIQFMPGFDEETKQFLLKGDNLPWLKLSQKAKESGVPLEVLEKIVNAFQIQNKNR